MACRAGSLESAVLARPVVVAVVEKLRAERPMAAAVLTPRRAHEVHIIVGTGGGYPSCQGRALGVGCERDWLVGPGPNGGPGWLFGCCCDGFSKLLTD